MWLPATALLLLCTWSVFLGSGGNSVLARELQILQGPALCVNPAFEWPINSGYCWIKSSSSAQRQQSDVSVWKHAALHMDAGTGQLHVLVKLGRQQSAAVAGMYLVRTLGCGDYVWQIDSSTAAVSAKLVTVAFVHAGRVTSFNASYAPASQQQQQQQQQRDLAAERHPQHSLPRAIQQAAGAAVKGRITQRLRWSAGNADDASPRVHFESYSDGGQLLASWTVQNDDALPSTDARLHLSFWMQDLDQQQQQQQQQVQPQQQVQQSAAQLVLSCFSFCPAGQQQDCSTPLRQKPNCQAPAAAVAAGSRWSGSGSSDSIAGIVDDSRTNELDDGEHCGNHPDTNQQEASAAAAVHGSQSVTSSSTEPNMSLELGAAAAAAAVPARNAARQAPACRPSSKEWPAGSRYCWSLKDSAGGLQDPGPNAFNSGNVAVVMSSGQLQLRVLKSGRGSSSRSSCAEVTLDRSLGLGTYVVELDTTPSLIHPNLVGSAAITQDGQHDFKLVELSRWALPSIPNAQYVVQPYQSNPPYRFNVSQARVTYRLRWSGSSNASQLQFDSFTADGALLQSWTAPGGNNFAPGTERLTLSFWIMKDANNLPARSTLAFNCFRFCPLGQDSNCVTAAGTPSCRGLLSRNVQPPPPAVKPTVASPSPLAPSPAPNPKNAPAPCAAWQFMWPAGSGYCWYRRDSGGQKQGPGNNAFASANAGVDAATGNLVVRVVKSPGDGGFTCGEVFLDRSLGFGDYVFVVQTDPSQMHPNLVASPFLYAPNAPDGSSRELDVVEMARWGQPGISNSQNVVQPWTSNPPHVFNVTGVGHMHRMRWSGSSSPQQVQFESYAGDGTLIASWTNIGGSNFAPGAEGVHINHWISAMATDLPASSSFVLSCFKFCPLGQEAACSTPLGTRPRC